MKKEHDPKKTEINENIVKNKKRKSMSQFFAFLNTDNSSDEYGNVVNNPKNKFIKWIFLGGILAITTVGIAVPLSLTSSFTNTFDKITDGSEIISTPLGKMTYAEWLEFTKAATVNLSEEQIIFEKSVAEEYYNQEREAYYKMKAFIDATKYSDGIEKMGATQFGHDVTSSYDDINKKSIESLKENKATFRRTLSTEKSFETEWIKELQTNEIYGKPSADVNLPNYIGQLENEAIKYMTYVTIKEPAFARFQAPIMNVPTSTDSNGSSLNTNIWTYDDLSLSLTSDINYKNADGENVVLTVAEGNAMWKSFLSATSNNWVEKETGSNRWNYIGVLENKSYILNEDLEGTGTQTSFRNPMNNTSSFIDNAVNIAPSAVISSAKLNIAPSADANLPWTVTQNDLKLLFKIKQYSPVDNAPYGNYILASEIQGFKGASTMSNTQRKRLDASILDDITNIEEATDPVLSDYSTGKISLGVSNTIDVSSLLSTTTDFDVESGVDFTRLRNTAILTSNGSNFSDSPTEKSKYEFFTANESNPFNEFVFAFLKLDEFSANGNKPSSLVAGKFDNWNEGAPSINLNNLINHIKTKVAVNSTGAVEITSNENISDWNTTFDNLSSLLQDSDFKFIGNLLLYSFSDSAASLGDSTNSTRKGYHSIYNISGNTSGPITYMFVSTNGIEFINSEMIKQQNVKTMLMNDLQSSINFDTDPVLNYKISSMMEKASDQNVINLNLLKNISITDKDKFRDALISANIIKSNEEFAGYLNKFQKILELKVENLTPYSEITSSSWNFLSKIADVKTNNYYDFSYVANEWNFNSVNLGATPIKGFNQIDTKYLEVIINIFKFKEKNGGTK